MVTASSKGRPKKDLVEYEVEGKVRLVSNLEFYSTNDSLLTRLDIGGCDVFDFKIE